MAPLHKIDNNVREQRLHDGCCPNCGTRLYKFTNPHTLTLTGGRVMSKLLRRRNSSEGTGVAHKMTPLTIPGVVERGQCLRCWEADDAGEDSASGGGGARAAMAVPAVKATPVLLSPPVAAFRMRDGGKLPPQSKLDAASDRRSIGEESSNTNRKQPPESLLEARSHLAGAGPNKAPASGSSEQSSSDSDDYESENGEDSSDDGSIDPLEDFPLLDLNLCPVEHDHGSSHVVNNLKRAGPDWGAQEDAMDDRKPAAKHVSAKRGSAREAAAIDMALLESSTAKKPLGGASDKLECPTGMISEVFYQLPPEMQKEVMEQQQRSDKGSMSHSNNSQTKHEAGKGHEVENATTTSAEIDPETLASLPDNIREEVLEQARREQQQSQKKAAANPKASLRRKFSQSTTDYLDGCDIDADDFEEFPEELQNDIMEQRRRDKKAHESESTTQETSLVPEDASEDADAGLSGYDPDTLASLPEDVRKEVLDEERRQRERRRDRRDGGKKTPSVVGAHRVGGTHSVNVPAGYDPDTFVALPRDVQQDLIDDARQAQQRIADARVVQARAAGGGAESSCAYTGDYNIMGKRHGEGELKWANGDAYVGTFKMGFIAGRGTINFHDGTEYAGQWKDNRFHGMGTRRFKNGNVYTGNYATGKRQGQGRCYFANGDLYVGDWKADTIHGFGRYYYNNGHSFEGMFRKGKRNGRGKYQLSDGRVEVYRYVDDARAGDGVRWSKSRKKAWRMNDGKVTKRVSIEEAAAIAKRCGPVVDAS